MHLKFFLTLAISLRFCSATLSNRRRDLLPISEHALYERDVDTIVEGEADFLPTLRRRTKAGDAGSIEAVRSSPRSRDASSSRSASPEVELHSWAQPVPPPHLEDASVIWTLPDESTVKTGRLPLPLLLHFTYYWTMNYEKWPGYTMIFTSSGRLVFKRSHGGRRSPYDLELELASFAYDQNPAAWEPPPTVISNIKYEHMVELETLFNSRDNAYRQFAMYKSPGTGTVTFKRVSNQGHSYYGFVKTNKKFYKQIIKWAKQVDSQAKTEEEAMLDQ